MALSQSDLRAIETHAPLPLGPRAGVGDLLGRIADDLRDIARDESALAKYEAEQSLRYAGRTLAVALLGAILALFSLGLLCMTAVIALEPVIASLPTRMLVMSIVYAGIGALLIKRCGEHIASMPKGLPRAQLEAQKTLAALKEHAHG